jgi:PncC family amidohydrolase
MTSLSGASTFFKAGVVSYSQESKIKILAISSDIIDSHGVVSKETAKEMAEKIRFIAKSDYAVSTTGNLGPEVLEGKEKGLVYVAACTEGKTICRELRLDGGREDNKEAAAISALNLLIELVEEGR